MITGASSFFGEKANEEYTLYLIDKKSKMPISIESIGVTHANPRYRMERKDSDIFILEYVISGKGYLELNKKKYALEAGDVYLLQPNTDHVYYSDENQPFEKIWINFYSSFFVDVIRSFRLSDITVFKHTTCRQYFNEIRQTALLSNYSDEICLDICPLIFHIVCALAEATFEDGYSLIPPEAKEIKTYLDNALYSTITIDEIARNLHLSRAQISRVFSKSFNCTPYNYLLNQKIEMAKKLLIKTNLSVNEISDKLAFNDTHYFSRIFKKKTGLSPVIYKTNKLSRLLSH